MWAWVQVPKIGRQKRSHLQDHGGWRHTCDDMIKDEKSPPERDISSLGAMGTRTWCISRVVRVARALIGSEAKSADPLDGCFLQSQYVAHLTLILPLAGRLLKFSNQATLILLRNRVHPATCFTLGPNMCHIGAVTCC